MKVILITSLLTASLVATLGNECGQSECGIYPTCQKTGQWEILEDCRRYISCTRDPDSGQLLQENLECPGDLVFANEYGDPDVPGTGQCVDYDRATACKTFNQPSTPCLYSCPRVYLESTGVGQESQGRRLGCFRLAGTLFGGQGVFYQNDEGQYLTPDATSNPTTLHWIISEAPGAFNGGVRNVMFDYIRCPFDDWNQGWEVDTGLGHWVEDPTMRLRCHKGEEDVCTSSHPVASQSPTTPRVSPCHKDGPISGDAGDCQEDFLCCRWQGNSYDEVSCHCKAGNVFSELFEICTNADICFEKDLLDNGRTMADHICDDGLDCWS